MKLSNFSDRSRKTILRRLDKIGEYFNPLIDSYNSNKTVEDRERDIQEFDKIAVLFCSLAVMLTKGTTDGREELERIAKKTDKTKFFDVAKDLKKTLQEYAALTNGLIKSYSSAGKEKNNRQKTICFQQLEQGVYNLFLELLEYVALIEMERMDWARAICQFHDSRRDNLILKNCKTEEE